MAARMPKEVVAERERLAWTLRTERFWTLQQIADELGLTAAGVHKILARVEQKLAKEFAGEAEAIKVRQTVQLEHIAREAMTEWERSKLDAEKERTSSKVGKPRARYNRETGEPYLEEEPSEDVGEIVREVKGRLGEAKLLEQARGALEDIRKIWAIDTPPKTKPQAHVILTGFEGWTDDELERYANGEPLRRQRSDDAPGSGAEGA